MNAAEVLSELRGRGVALAPDGDRLRWKAPRGIMTPDLLARIREHKPILLAALRAGTSPSLEFRITQWLNTNPPTPTDPDHGCAHCGKPEAPGAVILPFLTDNSGHIWLHGDCWPAWDARRRAEAVKALGTEGTP